LKGRHAPHHNVGAAGASVTRYGGIVRIATRLD
jgi:hypothetical protein